MKDTLERIIQQNGSTMQMIVAMEEMSELTKELSKNIRGFNNRDAIIEELADVYVCLMELEIIHQIKIQDLIEMVNAKIERLEERMNNESL